MYRCTSVYVTVQCKQFRNFIDLLFDFSILVLHCHKSTEIFWYNKLTQTDHFLIGSSANNLHSMFSSRSAMESWNNSYQTVYFELRRRVARVLIFDFQPTQAFEMKLDQEKFANLLPSLYFFLFSFSNYMYDENCFHCYIVSKYFQICMHYFEQNLQELTFSIKDMTDVKRLIYSIYEINRDRSIALNTFI